MSVLIKNGLVVTSSGSYSADVFVDGEKISAIGSDLGKVVKADDEVDAKGKYVLPGAIDPHTHLAMPFMGTTSKDDFETGTIAAACGGTTSLSQELGEGGGGGEGGGLRLGLVGSMAALLAHGLVDNTLFFPDLALTFFLVLALAQLSEISER